MPRLIHDLPWDSYPAYMQQYGHALNTYLGLQQDRSCYERLTARQATAVRAWHEAFAQGVRRGLQHRTGAQHAYTVMSGATRALLLRSPLPTLTYTELLGIYAPKELTPHNLYPYVLGLELLQEGPYAHVVTWHQTSTGGGGYRTRLTYRVGDDGRYHLTAPVEITTAYEYTDELHVTA